MYHIHAVNEHGEDKDEVEFTVLAPPGPPRGLPATAEVSDVHKEGCKLSWKEPADDGGSPITAYILEKMDIEDGVWKPCGKTDGALECNIEGLETGRRLKFRVKAQND
jgi:hypothetical protein